MIARVHQYRIVVDLRNDGPVPSTTTARFAASTPSAEIVVDGVRVRSAILNGAPLDISSRCHDRLPLVGLRDENELVVHADSSQAVRGYRDPVDGRRYVTAGADFLGGPSWFARLGASLKAATTLDVRHPDDWAVIGGGEAGRPLAPHLIAFAAGPFHTVTSEHDGIPLALHARASLAARLDGVADHLFATVAACIDQFHHLIGIQFPWKSLQFVFVPDVPWRAMEYPGCVQVGDSLLIGSHTGTAAERTVVLAHELAHMWFGNLVSPRHSGDVWLYEAIAEHLGRRVASAVAGNFAVRGVSVRRRLPAYHAASGRRERPLISHRVPVDRVGYIKGAAALADLQQRLGDAVFLAGLRGFLERGRDGVGGLAELLTSWEAAGAADLLGWQREWLADAGIPTVSSDGRRLRIDGASVGREVSVRALDRSGETVASWRMDLRDGATHLPALPTRTVLVLPNDDDSEWLYARFTPSQWRLVPDVAGHLDYSARSAVWTALMMAVASGDVDPLRALDVATELLAVETDDTLLDVHAQWTTEVLLWRYVPSGEARVAAALAGVFGTADSGSDLEAAAGRQWVDVAEAAPLLGMLDHLGWRMRWRAMTRLAVLGELDQSAISAELRGRGGGSTALLAARLQAALADAAAKERTWHMLTSTHAVSTGERVAAARMFWHPRHRTVTAPYVPRYFAALTTPGPVATLLARYGFPYTANADEVREYADRLHGNLAVPGRIQALIAEAVNQMRCAVDSLV